MSTAPAKHRTTSQTSDSESYSIRTDEQLAEKRNWAKKTVNQKSGPLWLARPKPEAELKTGNQKLEADQGAHLLRQGNPEKKETWWRGPSTSTKLGCGQATAKRKSAPCSRGPGNQPQAAAGTELGAPDLCGTKKSNERETSRRSWLTSGNENHEIRCRQERRAPGSADLRCDKKSNAEIEILS